MDSARAVAMEGLKEQAIRQNMEVAAALEIMELLEQEPLVEVRCTEAVVVVPVEELLLQTQV